MPTPSSADWLIVFAQMGIKDAQDALQHVVSCTSDTCAKCMKILELFPPQI
jgi:chemotaxis regulatin CheY-phosphate phosphatase CheZ